MNYKAASSLAKYLVFELAFIFLWIGYNYIISLEMFENYSEHNFPGYLLLRTSFLELSCRVILYLILHFLNLK